MYRIIKRIVSVMLVFALLFMATVPAFGASWRVEYISDLRLIYATSYSNAKGAVIDSGLTGYKVLSTNLNNETGKIGVYLAYKTTTDIEDAITDIAVMQMNGGYNEANYQAMIQKSYNDYLAVGDIYLIAIEYFNAAYDAGNYLAEIAHRQLNFYNVVTEEGCEIPSFEGEHIGDIFYDGIDAADLATMFLEGNSYALQNIRSLIAMGVSYNESGKTYLEIASNEAEKYTADKSIYDNEDYDELAAIIAPTITVFRNTFEEFAAHEGDLDYTDEEISEEELYYAEYKLMTEMARATNYLDGKTFYQFCLGYKNNKDDYSNLYPLVAALNDGQQAMTKVAHYYDVVRYSMTLDSADEIDTRLDEMEENYSVNPFNIYTGVDRTIYRDTFALTSDAYRSDAYTESGLEAALYDGKLSGLNVAATVVGSIGAAYIAYALGNFGYAVWSAKKACEAYDSQFASVVNQFAQHHNVNNLLGVDNGELAKDVIEEMFKDCYRSVGANGNAIFEAENIANLTIAQKYTYLDTYCNVEYLSSEKLTNNFFRLNEQLSTYQAKDPIFLSAQSKAAEATENVSSSVSILKGATILGGIMMLISALKLGYSIWHYYHPDYTDIPTAMVDLINTPDGDRYIKYDVVYELEPQSDGTLIAADLNAFSAERWNALYYTKSYEAGKPLLAGEFVVSTTNNVPGKKYMPVHRFGEVVCYNLNKYNFDDDYTIYLSVKQSDKQKSAVSGVPEIVGSVFGTGYIILAGGVGIMAGVGATIGTQTIIKRRKNKETPGNEENT